MNIKDFAAGRCSILVHEDEIHDFLALCDDIDIRWMGTPERNYPASDFVRHIDFSNPHRRILVVTRMADDGQRRMQYSRTGEGDKHSVLFSDLENIQPDIDFMSGLHDLLISHLA